MTYNDYLKQIIAFNGDKDIITLREKFNKPSFFEIISKERSKTTYSAFLKWLFQESIQSDETCNPMSLLLDMLVRRYEQQKSDVDSILSNEHIKRSIVTRRLTVKASKVEVEKSVSSLTQVIIRTDRKGVFSDQDLEKIAAKSKDRIDLFIACDIDCDDSVITAKRLQIIIENKIDAGEASYKRNKTTSVKAYDSASQTTRYYKGTRFLTSAGGKDASDIDTLQLYVYLTPQEPKEGGCYDCHFIQISYQDIVDGILNPMLASASLSARSRFFLEEFRDQLLFPSLDDTAMHPSIATSEQYADEITCMWNKYRPLLTDAAIAASEANLWTIDGTYYDHQPRPEILEMLLEKGVHSDYIVNDQWIPRMRFSKMQELAGSHGIETGMVELALDDNTQELLSSFWDKNKRLLTAMINGMKPEERKKTEALLTQLSKRDTTKYTVYYNNRLIGTNLGKGQAAFCVVCLWTKLQEEEGKEVTLAVLRKTFPRTFNPYYNNGKWFRYLFYEETGSLEYDGERAEGPVQGNWDFDKKGRFTLETSDGKKVSMLKMWRKDGLEHLIEMIEQKKLFDGSLDVVPM